MIHTNANQSEPLRRYLLVEVSGNLTEHFETFRSMRSKIDNRLGETGLEDVPGFYPVAAYHYVPYENPMQQRMNKVANGIFWELSQPASDGGLPEPYEQHDRITKLRGPVAFRVRGDSLTDSHVAAIREAHTRAVARLQSMGWM